MHRSRCNGALRSPLHHIIKSIGHCHKPPRCAATTTTTTTATTTTTRRPHSTLLARPLTSTPPHAAARACTARSPTPSPPLPPQRRENGGSRADPPPGEPRLCEVRSTTKRGYATDAAEAQQRAAEGVVSEAGLVNPVKEVPWFQYGAPPLDDTLTEDGYPEPRIRDGHEFGPVYFLAQQARHEAKQRKAEMKRARFKQRDPNTWKRLLRMLDQDTPAGPEEYQRVTEIVTLPKGVAAVFTPSKNAAILEIMQQTGSHVQMVAGYAVNGRTHAFTGLALQGSKPQNSAALLILPQYIVVSSIQTAEIRRRLKSKELRRQLKVDEAKVNEAKVDEAEVDEAEDDDYDDGTPEFWQIYDNEYLSKLQDNYAANTGGSPPGDTAPLRAVFAEDRVKGDMQPRHVSRRASALKSPIDFAAYVDDLASSRPKLAQKTSDQNSGRPIRQYVHFVTNELVSLFTNPATSHLASPTSIGRAFEYLTQHENIAAVRQILRTIDEEGRQVGLRGYNALLSAAADDGDIHNFEFVLRSMRRRGATPNPMTWTALHNLVNRTTPHAADTIPTLMRNKGLFADNIALRRIIQNTISQELKAHIHKRGSLAGFLDTYHERVSRDYGRPDFGWFSVSVLNRMLYVLVSLGRMKDAVTLLEEFRTRGQGSPSTATLNMFLSCTSFTFDVGSAIAILQLFRVGHPGAVVPNRATYQMLFMVAWRQLHYNMLRVIWRYACVAAEDTWDIRSRILISLLAYSPTEAADTNKSQIFKAWAGKFVLGAARDMMNGPNIPSSTSPDRHLDADELRLVELASQRHYHKGSAQSLHRRKELKQLQFNDLLEAGNCKPMLPLTSVLQQAWQKDLSWAKQGLGEPRDAGGRYAGSRMLKEMFLHGIGVPMRPGDCTQPRKVETPYLMRQVVLQVDGQQQAPKDAER